MKCHFYIVLAWIKHVLRRPLLTCALACLPLGSTLWNFAVFSSGATTRDPARARVMLQGPEWFTCDELCLEQQHPESECSSHLMPAALPAEVRSTFVDAFT